MEKNFDPSAVAHKNGSFYGLDYSPEEAELILFSVPWDVTTSYRAGTRRGPEAMLAASYQVDFFSPILERAWEMKLGTLPQSEVWAKRADEMRAKTETYISFLENGGDATDNPEMTSLLENANRASLELMKWTSDETRRWLKKGKKVITIGGDHSISYGPIQAYAEAHPGLSILHFDAHADLRVAYEGFEHSHASIMHNVMELKGVSKLVQVGIRDVSPDELARIKSDPKIRTYLDWELKANAYRGVSWQDQCADIVSHLGPEVYISFDIDGLDPKLCPNTGTPVPGGLELEQAVYLVQAVLKSGRKLIGADLVEVAPSPTGDEWDGNVGARLLLQLCAGVIASTR